MNARIFCIIKQVSALQILTLKKSLDVENLQINIHEFGANAEVQVLDLD